MQDDDDDGAATQHGSNLTLDWPRHASLVHSVINPNFDAGHQVMVNWHLSKHFICWPVSLDYVAGSGLELIKITFFKLTTAATTSHCHIGNTGYLPWSQRGMGGVGEWESPIAKITYRFDIQSQTVNFSYPCMNPPGTQYSLWRRLLAINLVRVNRALGVVWCFLQLKGGGEQ